MVVRILRGVFRGSAHLEQVLDSPYSMYGFCRAGQICPDLYDLYDLYDLHDLAHVARRGPYNLHGLARVSWVGSICIHLKTAGLDQLIYLWIHRS